MEKEFVCIACPMGCMLKVRQADGEIQVEGYSCNRGISYGRQEFSAPERVVTSTVPVEGRKYLMCPVKTDLPVPKERVEEVLRQIYGLRVKLPARVGDVVASGICGTKANVVVTANMGE